MLWIEWYFIQSANTFYSQVRPCDMKVGESKHVAMLLIHEWVSLNRQMWVCLFLVCSSEQALKLPIRCWRRNYFKFSLRKSVLQIAMGWLKPLNFIFISILLMWQQDFVGTLVKISFKMVGFEWVCLHIFLKVFNLIVDSKKVESVIVTDRLNAERLFSRPDQVPRNASKIITPDFFEYNPPIRGILHLG